MLNISKSEYQKGADMIRRTVGFAASLMLLSFLWVSVVFAGGSAEKSAGTASQPAASVHNVVFWNGYTGPDRATVEAIVAKFNESQSSVKIDMQISPWDSLFQKLMPAFIAGNGPDLIGYSVARLPEYAQAGRLAPLDSYLAASKNLNKDVLVPGLVQASTMNGKLYGVPMAFASMVMYFNKTEFQKAGLDPNNPPKTLSELAAAWKKLLIVDGAGKVTQYPQALAVRATVPMLPVVFWDYGARIVTDQSTSGLDSSESLAALKFLQGAFINDRVSPVGLTGQDADNLFAAGKAAIEWNGPWALTGFQKAGIDVGVAEMPSGPAGKYTWGGDTVMSMNKDSKVKESAWSFMEYWNSYDTQQFWSEKQAFPPTRTDMGNDASLQKNPYLKYFINGASYARIFLAGQVKSGQIDDEVLVPLWESVFSGKAQPEAALATAHAALTKILSNN